MTNIARRIAWVLGVLVILLAAAAFGLSYDALRGIAETNGYGAGWANLWPLTLDAVMIAASLAVLVNSLHGDGTRYQWGLVVGFTVASVGFNMIHAPDTWLARTVAAIPPVALFLVFELLMVQVKNAALRSANNTTIQAAPVVQPAHPILTANDLGLPPAMPTDRRKMVASLEAEGYNSTQIAGIIGVSLSTVKRELAAIRSNGHLKEGEPANDQS